MEAVDQIKRFFTFLGKKLQNFPTLSRGEQVSYISILLGLVLMITSLLLFLL